jgi:hypothetical protein
MEFKNWLKLQEVGTNANAIAIFSRPTIGMVKRTPVDMIGFRDEDKKDKKNKKQDDLDS